MPTESSKSIVNSDLVIDNKNRAVYYPNGLWRKGYILPSVDYVINFRRITQFIQWLNLFFMGIFWVLFYMRLPIMILLLLIPIYVGILFLIRYLKIERPLRQFEVCDEKFVTGNGLKDVVRSINGLFLWIIEIFFVFFMLLGLYTMTFKSEKWGTGFILTIFSIIIAALILYIILFRYRTKRISVPTEKKGI